MKLSPKQLAMLERARTGEDRMVPERYDPEARRVYPAFRWIVPPGCVVPSRSAEYAACRVLCRHGLLEPQVGRGGYQLTAKGRKEAAKR